MSVRRVGPRLRPLAAGLVVALVLAGGLSSLAMAGGVGLEPAMAADPPPGGSTTTTTSSTTTTTSPPPTTTTTPPRTTTTGPPPTTTTSLPSTTTVPGPPTSVPNTTTVPPVSTTVPQGQTGSAATTVLAVVVSTGDGLTVRSTDGTESPATAGESLQRGDQLSTTGSSGSSSAPHPATIRWLQGGMTDIYDATPRIFVRGHQSVPPVATTISIDADPTPTMSVTRGFARFWFPPAEKGWYSFVASTDTVHVTVKGTDFTIGEDPATKTSTVGVTQDTVEVAPVNPTLRVFQLSAGSEVTVTPDRVGPITPLADQSANNPKRASARSTTTTLALWLVGLLLTVAVASGAVGLASLWRDRRRGHGPDGGLVRRRGQDPPIPAIPPRPVVTPDLSFAHAGAPGATGWVTLSSGPDGEPTDPVPAAPEVARRQPETEWKPTHRVPPEGMKARAIPVADAGDVTSLDPDLAVRVVEHRGRWANVLSADGWSGWVDAGQLRPEADQA
jgi:hypothetical protein